MKPERPVQATERVRKIAQGRPGIDKVGGGAGRRTTTAAAHGPLDREAVLDHARKLEALRRRA